MEIVLIVLILCSTFLLVLVAYWIMPIKKVKVVNPALVSLLQILPITKVVESFTKKKKKDDEESK